MTELYTGQICAFGFDYAPQNWAKCEGQLLPISQYAPLFTLLGNRYGGDGRTTFALPDLRGAAVIGDSSSFPIGLRKPFTSGDQKSDLSYQALNYCILLNGIFPPRN
jgi:microcystin-dependent protein